MKNLNRRSFLLQSFATTAALGAGGFAIAQTPGSSPSASSAPAAPATEIPRPPPMENAFVKSFVVAGHANLPKVKELLAVQPMAIHASWDWGAGDWETALGGASHTGHREIALHLLESGARPDAYCAAMLGEQEFIASLIRFSPAAANARGPHGYSLMYHVGYSGLVPMAEVVGAKVTAKGRDFNQALNSATTSGHTDLVAWLLKNGVDNVNAKGFGGKTALDLAMEKGNEDLIKLLRENGGVSGKAKS